MTNKYIEIIERNGVVVLADESFLKDIDNSAEEFYKFKDVNKNIVKKLEDENGDLYRVANLHEKNTKLLNFLDHYLGEGTIYTSLFFESDSGQNSHRDTPYFYTKPECKHYGFWVTLEDTNSQNYILRVAKGAHKLPMFDRIL